jgi:type IV pilus assembly protein PilW
MSSVRSKQAGFSLIELMIALVIGLILVAGVLQVFVGSTITYSMQSGLSKIQENGRFAISFLSRDIRQAGFTGCSRNATLVNTLTRDASGAVPSFLDMNNVLSGRNDMDGSESYAQVPLAGTDVVEVRFADPVGACDIDNHDKGSERISCALDHTFQQGEILVATDCSHTAVFQFATVGASDQIFHGVDNSVLPGNCTDGLGDLVDCSNSAGIDYEYRNGSVMRMRAYRYYVANTSRGEPSLYRETISTSASGASGTVAQELVEGVEDMQILYGVDSDNDGMVNYYAPFSSGISDDIISVRVSLLIRSIEDTLVEGGQSLRFNGAIMIPPPDGRLRKVFTSTIALRNRL